jgi:hypothetical protein
MPEGSARRRRPDASPPRHLTFRDRASGASHEVLGPSALDGPCCAVRSCQLPHDPASALSTCTVARPCGFSLTAEVSAVRSSLAGQFFAGRLSGDGLDSTAALMGHSSAFVFSLAYRAHECERSARPCRSSQPKRQRSWGLVLRSFAPARQCAEGFPHHPTCRSIDSPGPGSVLSQGPAGVFGHRICRPIGASSIAAPGSSDRPAVPSRLVGIGRYCLGLRLFQGSRARFGSSPNCALAGSRHLVPAAGSRSLAGLDARLRLRTHPLMSLGPSRPALQRVGETVACSDPAAHASLPDRLPA